MRTIAASTLLLLLAACSREAASVPDSASAAATAVAEVPPVPGAPAAAGVADPGHSATAAPTPSTAAVDVAAPEHLAPPDSAADSDSDSAPAATITTSTDGPTIFEKTCATCHMADGSGVPYLQPSIRGSAWISNPDPQLLLSLILRGSAVLGEAAKAYENDMAPQDHLTNEQVAAVATYVRGRFGKPPVEKPVTPDEVAIARNRPGLP